jgi:hypothetical protein
MTRRRYVYTDGGVPLPEPIEVSEDWTNAERRAPAATEELVYGGAQATDGTPINTRKRHREYLASKGLAMASDYSPEYLARAKAEKQRNFKEAIARAYDMTLRKRK